MTLKEQRAQFFPVGTQPRRQQQEEEALMPPLPEKQPHAGQPSSSMPISRSASAAAGAAARTPLPPPPQAASRHRVGHTAGAHPEDQPFIDEEEEEEELYPKRPPSNVIRRRASVTVTTTQHPGGPVVRRRNAVQTDQVTPSASPALSPRGQHRRLLLGMGIGMCSFGVLFVAGEHALSWWERMQDDWHYGNPRTFQIDAVVGHDDSPNQPSHFIAENLHGQILIIEFPGGDPSKARVFLGPLLGKGADLTPVTLAFQDVNGDGLLDLVVTVGELRFVLINDKGTFRPLKSDEHVTL